MQIYRSVNIYFQKKKKKYSWKRDNRNKTNGITVCYIHNTHTLSLPATPIPQIVFVTSSCHIPRKYIVCKHKLNIYYKYLIIFIHSFIHTLPVHI